jgi:hypothetical protein
MGGTKPRRSWTGAALAHQRRRIVSPSHIASVLLRGLVLPVREGPAGCTGVGVVGAEHPQPVGEELLERGGRRAQPATLRAARAAHASIDRGTPLMTLRASPNDGPGRATSPPPTAASTHCPDHSADHIHRHRLQRTRRTPATCPRVTTPPTHTHGSEPGRRSNLTASSGY